MDQNTITYNKRETTFVIIKPDVVQNKNAFALLDEINTMGFEVICLRQIHLDSDILKQHYKEHEGKEFYMKLISFMMSGAAIIAALEGDNAISRLRSLIPGLRAKYGTDVTRNAIHASDSAESATRELALWDNKF
jgi:nucleoside-diphosphate kinase